MCARSFSICNGICGLSIKAWLVGVVALPIAVYAGGSLAADDAPGGYDQSILFNPSRAVRLAEEKGRVTVYDGLEHKVVDQALDTQFERIESMMFVRMRETLPDGEVETDEDCD